MSADPVTDLREAVARFFESAREAPAHAAWTWAVDARLMAGHHPIDVCLDVRDPAGVVSSVAVAREPDGSVQFLYVAERSGEGPSFRAVWAPEVRRYGPADPVVSLDAWCAEVMAVAAPIAQGTNVRLARTYAHENAAFGRFAAEGLHPRIESWHVARTITVPSGTHRSGHIELWVGVVVAAGPFVYPHLAGIFADDGRLLAVAAVEAMPTVHSDVFLGVFEHGGHTNLGDGRELLDPDAFLHVVVGFATSILAEGQDQIRPDVAVRRDAPLNGRTAGVDRCGRCGGTIEGEQTHRWVQLDGRWVAEHLACPTQGGGWMM